LFISARNSVNNTLGVKLFALQKRECEKSSGFFQTSLIRSVTT